MIQIPRGTRDFTPEDMHIHHSVLERIRDTFDRFGYQEIQTPTFEQLELFTLKSGEPIIQEIYDFTDKGGRQLALRPELTAPVMRFYVDQLQMRAKPLKLFYIGNCFRYDRPQKGRYREFWQAGCELIGPDTPEAYAELIALAYTIFYDLGLRNIHVNIGNLTLIQTLLDQLGLSESQKNHILPLIDKGMFDELHNALRDFSIDSKNISEFITILTSTDITSIITYLKQDLNIKKVSLITTVLTYLQQNFSIPGCHIKLSIVRGLDYYKGIVFEIEAPALGAEKQLCGGGAYELIPLFGGKETPTSGFAIGVDRTILALKEEKRTFTMLPPEIFIIPVDEKSIPQCLTLASLLRNHGFSTDIDLLRRGISKALKYANTKNFQYSIIIGPDEIKQKTVTLRNMKTGKQKRIKTEEIITFLQS